VRARCADRLGRQGELSVLGNVRGRRGGAQGAILATPAPGARPGFRAFDSELRL